VNSHARNGISFRRWLGAAALAGVSLTAQAQATFGAGSTLGAAVTGNTVTVGVYTGGGAMNNMSMTTPSGSTMTVPPGWATANSNGSPVFTTKGQGPIPGVPGKSVPVDVVAKPTAATAGRALANFAKKMGPIGTGLAIYDLLSELGVLHRPAQGTGGGNEFYENDTLYTYSIPPVVSNASSVQAAVEASEPGAKFCGIIGLTNDGNVRAWRQDAIYVPYGNCMYANEVIVQRTATGTTEKVITETELAERIAAKDGTWPSSSAVPRALGEALNSGEKVILASPPKVTGPSSVPGPSSTTTTNTPTGTSTATTTKTVNLTYNGNQYTTNITNNTTTNTTNNTTNVTETTTETTQEETPPEDDYCKKYPNTVGCAELDEQDDSEIPKKTENVTYEAENVSLGGGSCPGPWGWSDSLGSHQLDIAPYCDVVTTVVRPILLAFGALAALMICMQGIRGD
jgi:hypothetical protein